MADADFHLPESTNFVLRDASGAGRGVFARKALPAGTHLLTTSLPLSPTAHVILRPYRREVCAFCFAYDRGREWKVRPPRTSLSFCKDECYEQWGERHGEEGLEAYVIFEAFVQKQSKQHDDTEMEDTFFDHAQAVARWGQATLTGEHLLAARKATRPSKEQKRLIRTHSEAKVDPDILSFLLSTALTARASQSTPALLALEENPRVYETASLEEHIKAYHLLLAILPLEVLPNVRSDLCHEYVSRASHNAFSIRPTADGNHSGEFLGYGVWPEACFFNHSCRPNVRKSRDGREWSFWASTDIQEGEELCITYLGGEEKDLDVEQRRDKLKTEWGFWCGCKRCIKEGGS